MEAPHLGVRGPLSVAQVYTQQELERLARVYPGRIRAFPAKLSPRAREEIGAEKPQDAEAIWHFVTKHPEVSLMYWPRDTSFDDALTEQRTDMTVRLNVMRPAYDSPEVEHARSLLHSADLSLQTASWFDFKTVFKGKTNERLDFNKTAVMAVYVAVRNEDGTLRTDPNGRPIGYRWFKKLLKQHPYHDKAGTARSNLMWHFLRNALHEKENGRDQQGRAAFRKALKELFRALQKD